MANNTLRIIRIAALISYTHDADDIALENKSADGLIKDIKGF
jgi:hypothetical protein